MFCFFKLYLCGHSWRMDVKDSLGCQPSSSTLFLRAGSLLFVTARYTISQLVCELLGDFLFFFSGGFLYHRSPGMWIVRLHQLLCGFWGGGSELRFHLEQVSQHTPQPQQRTVLRSWFSWGRQGLNSDNQTGPQTSATPGLFLVILKWDCICRPRGKLRYHP